VWSSMEIMAWDSSGNQGQMSGAGWGETPWFSAACGPVRSLGCEAPACACPQAYVGAAARRDGVEGVMIALLPKKLGRSPHSPTGTGGRCWSCIRAFAADGRASGWVRWSCAGDRPPGSGDSIFESRTAQPWITSCGRVS